VLLGGLAASAYFVHHTISGTYGLAARSRLTERSSMLEREIASLEAVRRRLRRDVELLATEPPDPDLVEEFARSVLGFAKPADLTLIEAPPHPALARAHTAAR
jgi:cell division protein FtsB